MRLGSVLLVLLLGLSGCSGTQDPGLRPADDETTDADCARTIPDAVLATLGWTDSGTPAEATVRGCHREAEQGYVELRDRAGYDELCATLDRTGGVSPGATVDWLGADVTACAVEPTSDVGQTRVVVQGDDGAATQVTVTAVAPTARERVRAAIRQLLG